MNRESRIYAGGSSVRRLMISGTAIAAVFGFAAPSVALAQEQTQVAANEPVAVGEVIVTARKREEKLRDVPMAASVLDAELIDARGGQLDTGEIVTATPGARFNNLSFTTLSEVTIRSSGTARGTNAETGVGLYANGVYVAGGLQFARNYTRIDFFDLGRAEVLRGTLGALYGRNAVGGAVNLIAQVPQFDTNAKLSLDYGWDVEKKQVQAILNHNFTEQVAVRIGAEFMDQDEGNYHLTPIDRYSDEKHGWLFRGQARFRQGPLDIVFLAQSEEMTIGGGLASLDIAAGSGCSTTMPPYVASANNNTVCYTQDYVQTPYVHPHDTIADVGQDVHQAVLTINYDFQSAMLTSVTSFRRRETLFQSDADNMSAAELQRLRNEGIVVGGNNMRTDRFQYLTDQSDTYFQDIHLASSGAGPLTWLAGAEYLRIDSTYIPLQISNGSTGAGSGSRNGLSYYSWAAYGSLGYDMTERLNLSAELRYTDDDKRFWTQSATVVFPDEPTYGDPRTLDFANTNWSYNLVGKYTISEWWMAYAKVGSGYRAGGFNSSTDPAPPAMPPRPVTPTFGNEESLTYEIGAKGNITPALYVTLAAYRTKVEGAITQVDNGCFLGSAVCNARPSNYAINGGDANLSGLELEAVWNFFLGDGQGQFRGALSRQWGEFDGGDYDGFEIPQKPDTSASANLDYSYPFGAFTGILNVNYRGQWGGVEGVAVGGDAPQPLSDFNVFDLRIGARFENLEISLYSDNVTDEQFTLLDAATSVRWSPPRNSGIQLRYRWQ